jgi:hypothetical protein
MSESQKLYRLFRRLAFTPEQARYSTRKLIACKRRIDEKYSSNVEENPFFLSPEKV